MNHCRHLILIMLLVNHRAAAVELSDYFTVEPAGRYRYQEVHDPVRGDAQASTLKLRLSANWQLSDNWQTFGEVEFVHAFNERQYNSVTVQRATSPIPDPPGQEINQLFIKYLSDGNWSATMGRQAVSFDDERHVGRVEFWQNDQTFDAAALQYQDHLKWTANYAYIDKVQRIFGNDADPILSDQDIRFIINPVRPVTELGEHDHDSHLFNLNYALDSRIAITLYGYLLENQTAQVLSSDTWGARLNGSVKPARIKYGYTIEYAQQSNGSNNPWQYTADYWLLETSVQYKSHQLALSFEQLGEDNGFSFTTSLGTNHKFQGWADVFNGYRLLSGIQDTYLSYRGRNGKLRWRLVAHKFEDADGRFTVGHELDLELAYRFNREWEFKLIGAKYFADQGFSNSPATQRDLSTWMLSAAYNL